MKATILAFLFCITSFTNSKLVQKGNFVFRLQKELPSPGCDDYYQLNNGWCYERPMACCYPTVDELRDWCLMDGGDLVSIHSKQDDAFLRSFSPGSVIGLRYNGGSSFAWTDATQVDYKNLEENFISHAESFGYCAKLGNSKWENTKCGKESQPWRYFICKKAPSLTPNYVCPNPDKVYQDSGEITSSSYPASFDGRGEDCLYKLIVKSSSRVQFDLVRYNFNCGAAGFDKGSLTVYEGFTVSDNARLGRYSCKSMSVTRFTTKRQNRMLLVFNVPGDSFAAWKGTFKSA